MGADDVCLILGDNIFYGHGLTERLRETVSDIGSRGGATVFGYYVSDPGRYGIAEFDENQNVISIEEKPQKPKSNYAVTGCIFMITASSKSQETPGPRPEDNLRSRT